MDAHKSSLLKRGIASIFPCAEYSDILLGLEKLNFENELLYYTTPGEETRSRTVLAFGI